MLLTHLLAIVVFFSIPCRQCNYLRAFKKTLLTRRKEEAKEYTPCKPLVYWEDEGWIVGRIKEMPGVFSQGETLDELKENILDAYQLMIEDDQPIPKSGG